MPPPSRLLSGTTPFPLPSTAPCPSPRLDLPSPLLPSPSPSLSLYTFVFSLLPLPQQLPGIGPLPTLPRPRLLFTSVHWPFLASSAPLSSAPFDQTGPKQNALRSVLFGRMKDFHSVWPIRPNKTVFDRPNKTRSPLFGSDWPNGKPMLGRCQGVGRRWGPKRNTERRPVPRSGGMLRKGKETGAAPKSGSAREGRGNEKGRGGDEGGTGEEGLLGKGEKKGWRRRGREGRRLDGGCGEKRER